KKIYIALVILCLGLVCPSFVFSQESLQDFSLSLSGDQMVESTVSLRNAILVSHVEESVKADYIPKRRYIVLDTKLRQLYDTIAEVAFRRKHKANYVGDSLFYDFFYDYRLGEYSLVTADKNMFFLMEGTLPNKMYEPQLVITSEANFFLDRRINKERIITQIKDSSVYHSTYVHRKKKRTKVFPMYFDKVENSDDVAYIWREKSQKVDDIFVGIWESDGEAKDRFKFVIPGKSVHGITIRQFDEDRILLTGTYAKASSVQASGAFFAIVEDGATMLLNTYSFSELPHFFNYLDRYEKEEMKRKLARLKKHVKSTEIRTHALAHSIIAVDRSFLLTIEFYSEVYDDYYGVRRNGNTIAGSPQSLKGYDYSHAICLRIDHNGQVKHDYFFDITLDYTARKKGGIIRTQSIQDTLLLGYAGKNKFYFGSVKPLVFATMKSDTSFVQNDNGTIRRDAQFLYLPDGSVLVYGFKTQKGVIGQKKKADIYFIEKRKVR
ncbi:MAG: hypothetical protein ACI8SE_000712, partial [Bacteroidia bacterium]